MVTDTRTGLMWTRDANIARKLLNWNSGVNLVHGLNTGSPNGLKPYVGSVAIPIEQEDELVWAVRDVR